MRVLACSAAGADPQGSQHLSRCLKWPSMPLMRSDIQWLAQGSHGFGHAGAQGFSHDRPHGFGHAGLHAGFGQAGLHGSQQLLRCRPSHRPAETGLANAHASPRAKTGTNNLFICQFLSSLGMSNNHRLPV